jgi:beta-lactamase superfamily II metal-dependent hydrolase
LIDGGPTNAGPAVLKDLNSYHVIKIDLMVATHPHEDHIGGLIAVLQSTIPIQDIIYNGYNYTITQTFNTWKTLALAHNLTQASRNQVYAMSPTINFTVISPTNPLQFSDINSESIVMRLQVGKTSLLLKGDATTGTEASMLASGYNLHSQLLKVGHHGSSTSTSQAFLSAVNPNYAAISAGLKNRYGHPAQQTLDKLASNNIITYGTYNYGTIIFSLNSTTQTPTPSPIPNPTPAPTLTPTATPNPSISPSPTATTTTTQSTTNLTQATTNPTANTTQQPASPTSTPSPTAQNSSSLSPTSVVPEFPALVIIPFLIVITTLAFIIKKREKV